MKREKERFETKVIHEGYDSLQHSGSLAPPLFQTSTFTFSSAEEGEARFAGQSDGYIYSRLGNPTVRMLEEKMTALENGGSALAFGSGMAAVSAILLHLLKTGDHVICSRGVYGCTFGLLEMLDEKFHISHAFADLSSEGAIRSAITNDTACIYVETPINPTMELIDLGLVCKVAKEYGLPVVVDNTFSSPYLQQPLETGADYVVHSATKYIGGHGDVIAGILVGADAGRMNELRMTVQKDIGGILSPFDAWLLNRGLKTLAVRMDRHCDNAERIVTKLIAHEAVKNVFYPGMPEHPSYEIARRQMKRPGGMISFELHGTKEQAQQFMNRLSLIKIAVSLGDAESLIQHPASMTHAIVPDEMKEKMGITDTLLRLSVGLESWEDIWEDLLESLNAHSAMSAGKEAVQIE